ncbi:histidinol-phosphatase [soil metagenome]
MTGSGAASHSPEGDGSWHADLSLAHELADAARAVIHDRDRSTARSKPDGTPVTDADLHADATIVALLRDRRPDDAILSEESGSHGDPAAPRRWIVDPLDGTHAFLTGQGGWGTLIALEVNSTLVLGLINHIADGRRYWATRGGGAWSADLADGELAHQRPLQVSSVTDLKDARVTAWPPVDTPAVRRLRTVGTWIEPDSYFLRRLIEGEVDVLLTTGGQVWDHAAQVIVVEEAGGRFQDPEGGRRLDLKGGLYTNGHLHDAVVTFLASGSNPSRADRAGNH